MIERVKITQLPTKLVVELIEAKKFGKTAEILADAIKKEKEKEKTQKKDGDKDDIYKSEN